MTIQDDIFDVTYVLEGTPEEKSFKRIIEYMIECEEKREQYGSLLRDLQTGLRAFQTIMNTDTE